MTTRELIEHLSKLPQDADVFIYIYGDVREVSPELAPYYDTENFNVEGNFIVAE